MIRQPIITIMGHVDHGKTLLLDKIRGTTVAAKEVGGITQAIGASIVPKEALQNTCKTLLEALKMTISIPGILFIDTPGHSAFNNLRKRGGNLADIAILVIDINEGPQEQTIECIKVLRQYKTPFIIALNKIDTIQGWKNNTGLAEAIKNATPDTIKRFEQKLYTTIAKIYELGFEAERFDRVTDHTKTLAIIPISAKTGQGIPEILMTVTGLAQKYLGEQLITSNTARGTILEVKNEKGLGKVIDTIIYDGKIKINDILVIGGIEKPIITKIKALFQTAPMQEMRTAKFKPVQEAYASTGVRIVCPGIDDAIAGVPIIANMNEKEAIQEVQKEIQEVVIQTDNEGVIAKADSLGSLEALTILLKQNNIPIKKAGIGIITKKDITDAQTAKNPLHKIILGFNIPKTEGAITNEVVYRLVEEYKAWAEKQKKQTELAELSELTKPCQIEVLKGYVFRQSNPAIVGVHVQKGELKNGTPLINKKGEHIATVKGIQIEKEQVEKIPKDGQGAISLPGIIIGRQLKEGETLLSEINEQEFTKYKEYKHILTEDDKELLKEIAQLMREKNPVWGV